MYIEKHLSPSLKRSIKSLENSISNCCYCRSFVKHVKIFRLEVLSFRIWRQAKPMLIKYDLFWRYCKLYKKYSEFLTTCFRYHSFRQYVRAQKISSKDRASAFHQHDHILRSKITWESFVAPGAAQVLWCMSVCLSAPFSVSDKVNQKQGNRKRFSLIKKIKVFQKITEEGKQTE